jgi:hypothetical protein
MYSDGGVVSLNHLAHFDIQIIQVSMKYNLGSVVYCAVQGRAAIIGRKDQNSKHNNSNNKLIREIVKR